MTTNYQYASDQQEVQDTTETCFNHQRRHEESSESGRYEKRTKMEQRGRVEEAEV